MVVLGQEGTDDVIIIVNNNGVQYRHIKHGTIDGPFRSQLSHYASVSENQVCTSDNYVIKQIIAD